MDSKRIESFGVDIAAAYKTISEYKWNTEFICSNCSSVDYFEGKYPYSRRCLNCKKDLSPTEGTVFHGIRFPLNIALYIVWVVATKQDRITSEQLTEDIRHKFKVDLRQKTVWAFQMKIYESMTMPALLFDNDITVVRFTRRNNTIVAARGNNDFKSRQVALLSDAGGEEIVSKLRLFAKKQGLDMWAYDVAFLKQTQRIEPLFKPIGVNPNEATYIPTTLAYELYSAISGVNMNHHQAYLNYYCFTKNGYDYNDLMSMMIVRP